MKVIELKMKSGRVYHVPLKEIAENRARHYEIKDKTTTFKEEFDFVMEDDFEGIDWYQNNMNPEDVCNEALLVKDVKPLKFENEEVEWIYIIETQPKKEV